MYSRMECTQESWDQYVKGKKEMDKSEQEISDLRAKYKINPRATDIGRTEYPDLDKKKELHMEAALSFFHLNRECFKLNRDLIHRIEPDKYNELSEFKKSLYTKKTITDPPYYPNAMAVQYGQVDNRLITPPPRTIYERLPLYPTEGGKRKIRSKRSRRSKRSNC